MKYQSALIYDLKNNLIHIAIRENENCVWEIKKTRMTILSIYDLLNAQVSAVECIQFALEAIEYSKQNNFEFIGIFDKEKL